MKILKKEDVDLEKVKINAKALHVDNYDMYYVYLPMKDGSKRKVRVFTDAGTLPPIDSDEIRQLLMPHLDEIRDFFINRLFGTDGLVAQQNRDDFIYLGGDLLQNDKSKDVKVGEKSFKDNLFELKMKVFSLEKSKKEQTFSDVPKRPIQTVYANQETSKPSIRTPFQSLVNIQSPHVDVSQDRTKGTIKAPESQSPHVDFNQVRAKSPIKAPRSQSPHVDFNQDRTKGTIKAPRSQSSYVDFSQDRSKSKTPKESKQKKGKNYVISDIHGMYGSYIEAMRKMTPNDHIYILGDVIDRGKNGIKILKDIMERSKDRAHNPEITFLLGNHEMQFLQTISIMMRKGLKKSDILTILNRATAKKRLGWFELEKGNVPEQDIVKCKKTYERYNAEVNKLVREKSLTNFDVKLITIWLGDNHGLQTFNDFIQSEYVKTPKDHQEMYSFLMHSDVLLSKTIKGQDYLFVHAVPPREESLIHDLHTTNRGYTVKDLKPEQYEFVLQSRDRKTFRDAKREGFITICGHEPEIGSIVKDKDDGFIRVDAGCGSRNYNSKLALYCIDDGKVQYIEERENDSIDDPEW